MALFVFNARVRLVDPNLSWTSPDDFHTKHCSMEIMVDSCLYTSEEWSDVIRVMTGCIRMNHADERDFVFVWNVVTGPQHLLIDLNSSRAITARVSMPN